MPTLQPGSTSQAFDVDIGQTVSVTPGSGGTMLVEYTTNSETDIRNGSATWQAWTAGTVASATSDVAMFPMFARVTAYTAAGSYGLSGSGLRAVPNQYLAWKSDVVSARDPVSAAAAVGSGASIQSRKLSNVLTKSFLGRYTTLANGADHTTSIQMALESPYDAVRFIIPNSVTSSIANCKMKITTGGAAGTAGTSGAQAPSDGSWKSILVGGSSTFTLAAGTSVDLPSFTVTDWYDLSSLTRTDGGTLPLLWARILIPAAAANRPAWNYTGLTNWETESAVAGRIFRCRTQAVNGVDTLSNFTVAGSASDYQCVPIIVQYRTRVNGVTIMTAGDSIYEKAGSTSRYGWQDISQAAVSTPSRPIEIATMAIGGSNSTTMSARINACLSVINPDFCILPGYEVNDMSAPMTQAEINLNERNVETSLGYLRAADVVSVIATGLPTDPTGTFAKDYGSSDALRQDRNNRIRASRWAYVADFDAVLAGETDSDGQVLFKAGTTSDALHPNNTGHSMLAEQSVSPLFSLIQAANL